MGRFPGRRGGYLLLRSLVQQSILGSERNSYPESQRTNGGTEVKIGDVVRRTEIFKGRRVDSALRLTFEYLSAVSAVVRWENESSGRWGETRMTREEFNTDYEPMPSVFEVGKSYRPKE